MPRFGFHQVGRWRLVTVVCLTLGVFGLGPVGARAATTPPSLAGENFGDDQASISPACTSGNGTFTFSVSGNAASGFGGAGGPYPGSYTEAGSFTLSNDVLTAFSAHFTITSPTGSVKGSKSLSSSGLATTCFPGSIAFLGNADVTYTATIDGAFRDTGTGVVAIGPDLGPEDFVEQFTTSNGVVALPNGNGQGQNNNNQGQNNNNQ